METLEKDCDGRMIWPWYNVESDLNKALGDKSVSVDPSSVGPNGCGGTYKGDNKWFKGWRKNEFLRVSMQQYEQRLVDAFSKVVGYRPFCKYIDPHSRTIEVEWVKNDPNGRFAELKNYGAEGLEKLV